MSLEHPVTAMYKFITVGKTRSTKKCSGNYYNYTCTCMYSVNASECTLSL